MASPAPKQAATPRRCDGVLSRAASRYARRRGIDVTPLLERAGLTAEEVTDRNARIEVTKQIKFIQLVADALHDDLLGFHLAESFDFREIGLLYYVAASADTLGNGLRRAERYIKLQNEGVRFKVSRDDNSVRIRFQYAGVPRHTDVHQILVPDHHRDQAGPASDRPIAQTDFGADHAHSAGRQSEAGTAAGQPH